MKTCPYCAEEIQDAAIKCKHCGEMLGRVPVDEHGQDEIDVALDEALGIGPTPAKKANGSRKAIGCLIIFGAITVFGVLVSDRLENQQPSPRNSMPAAAARVEKKAVSADMERMLQSLRDTQILMKFDVDYNEAYIEPGAWARMDLTEKSSMSAFLAEYCDQSGSTGRVTIYDGYSGKKLARFSQAFGFKVYP